ncbi:hypothetical protein ACI65C_005154 [Semiaphis heraclei]
MWKMRKNIEDEEDLLMLVVMLSRPTQQQMQELVELLNGDPQLVAGKFTPTFTQKVAQKRWEAISKTLNALPGTYKCWTSTKSKAAEMSAFVRRGTGGGPPTSLALNSVEENALQLIKPVSISGHTLSAESYAEFSFEPDNLDTYTDVDDLLDKTPSIHDLFLSYSYQPTEAPVTPTNNMFPKLNPTVNSKVYGQQSSIVQEKVNCNTNKRTSSAARLGEGNLIGERLADLGERKLLAKQKYWDQKCLF